MNPASPQLDPKLKETYDRVMGAQFTPQPPQVSKPVQPSASAFSSGQSPAPIQSPSQSAPAEHVSPSPAQVFVASPATPTGGKTAVVKNSSGNKISPVVLIAVGFAFFVVYTIVWLKVFAIF